MCVCVYLHSQSGGSGGREGDTVGVELLDGHNIPAHKTNHPVIRHKPAQQ